MNNRNQNLWDSMSPMDFGERQGSGFSQAGRRGGRRGGRGGGGGRGWQQQRCNESPPCYNHSSTSCPNTPMHDQGIVTSQKVQDMVKALAQYHRQKATAEMLSRQIQGSEDEVVGIAESRKDIFYLQVESDVIVKLVPNIRVCSGYLSENGCSSKASCTALHMCMSFILDCCSADHCQFGHTFDTDHNIAVLSKFHLDLIDSRVLFNIIKKVCKDSARPQVCSGYNTANGCKKKKCNHFHICRDFLISGGKCPSAKCPYAHHFNSKQCQTLLIRHGISVNESQRDILYSLKSVMRDLGSQPSGGRKESSSENNTETRSGTIRSTDVYGDVEVPEICVYGVNNRCLNEEKGCKYLHAKSLFYWQVQKQEKWYNLRVYQSKCLENAYRDVSVNEVGLPPLDPNRLQGQDRLMLNVLGTDAWIADFTLSVIKNSSGTELGIRRLSTASSVVSKMPQATVYGWFFKDEQGKWIQYGHIDSLGKQNCVCNITSDDIEKQYMQNPSTPVTISSAQFKYQLDFKRMIQTNMTTGKIREVRRRPTGLAYQQATRRDSREGSLPAHWLPMKSDQTHLLVMLDSGSREYQDVVSRVRLTLLTATIVSVHKLQNQYLWRLMQYKKADFARSFSSRDMNIQKLFHGTTSDQIDGICKENIDGRKSSSEKHNKHPYGKGTYFSNSCAIARSHSTPDSNNHSIIVLTEVLIGAVTEGSPSLRRPPVNPDTGALFDTTVDSVTAPTVFVKYDKEEYYPEYVIALR